MKKYNLHIARSPLQLINVIEAIDTLELKNNILLILDRKSQTNTEQMQDVLKIIDYKWEMIFHLDKQSNSNFIKYIKLIKNINKFNYENIFIGDVDSISTVIISNLKHNKVFLVDDGTSTLMRHNSLMKKKRVTLKEKLKLLRFSFFGLNPFNSYKMNFFSFFDLKQKKDEIIVRNEFKNLKKRFELKDNSNQKVYILGQPLYNNDISEESFLTYLKKLFTHFDGKELIYLKHRYEVPTQSIKKLLLENNVKIEQNKYPIELEFLVRKEYPMYITGFFSTAIYTLSNMFKDSQVTSFYIDKKDFLEEDRGEVVNDYYDFFKNSGINIIE